MSVALEHFTKMRRSRTAVTIEFGVGSCFWFTPLTLMDDTNSLIEQRKAKLAALKAKGIDPFKNKFTPTESCDAAREKYKRGEYNDTTEVAVAGRITAHREMGKSMFIDLRDQSGRIQIYAQKNALEEKMPGSWDVFTHLDLGDFIGATGTLFRTKTNEPSVKIESFTILSKALRPPSAKWHGLEDTEIRYRQRYLDLMANPEVKDVFLKRSEIIREIRNFLHARGFVEVETPMMQAIPGGAAAQPFKTHHNALGCDFYLRIALELYLKRLLVGGVDKVFEIGRNFRNEGLSRKHNPEFTMLEAYQAFGDYESMMELVESMVKHVAQKVLGTLKIQHDRTNDVNRAIQSAIDSLDYLASREAEKVLQAESKLLSEEEYKKLTISFAQIRPQLAELLIDKKQSAESRAGQASQFFVQGIRRIIDLAAANRAPQQAPKGYVSEATIYDINELSNRVIATHEYLQTLSNVKIIDLTNWERKRYKDLIREKAGANWFEISPAERRQRAHDLGAEITKDYADFEVTGAVFEKLIEPTLIQPTFVTHLPKELVPLAKLSPDDPTTVEVFECCINGQEIAPAYTEQNDPIEQRERLEHQAGGEQQKLDEDFLVALEHGMPPAGGMGMGIDRLCMMLLGQESIRDVILFPQLKPR
jgi:lysyl-tRNA synthetase